MNVVISQPMYFPWIGFMEQLASADVFVVYDDVQFSKGSFTNRVQIKTAQGIRWITVPLEGVQLGMNIKDVAVCSKIDWRERHRDLLWQAYRKASFVDEMLHVAENVFSSSACSLEALATESTSALTSYFGVGKNSKYLRSSDLGIGGSGSARVLNIVQEVGGSIYTTGHGAKHYLDHESFERAGIEVRYMQYSCAPYPQLHGEFTPFVSSLDLLANCGLAGVEFILPRSTNWRDFIHGSA